MKIEKIILQGSHVRLEPLSEQHLQGLRDAIEDGKLWELPVTFVPRPEDLGQFLDDVESAFYAGKELAFAILDIHSGKVLGSTRFRCIETSNRRVEIGYTFLALSSQRTYTNTEAKYLMLCHAFEVWGCNRVELLTDERNIKSRQAIQRIGGKEEGILRCHMVMRDGFIRNSVLYSLIAADWHEAKANFYAKINA